MTLAIMQPYFLPYIGYWQLLQLADEFVVYDNIQFTKKGWISRNRYLCAGADKLFTLPLAKDSDYLDVCQRRISPEFDKTKLHNQIRTAYAKAPYCKEALALFDTVLFCEEDNLFAYLLNSIKTVAAALGIDTTVTVSSTVDIDHTQKGKDRVLALCKAAGADRYVNPIGGTVLYDKQEFAQEGIALSFLKARGTAYPQFENEFVPYLSILDVLMFKGIKGAAALLEDYDLQ